MRGGLDLHHRTEQGIAAYRDLGDIENHAVEIEVHVFAEADVAAVVAEERWRDVDVGGCAEKLCQQIGLLCFGS